MCGIAGVVSYGDAKWVEERSILERMQHAIRRRGPDQQGIYTSAHVAFVHTRLSVVDLEGGRQPMHFMEGERHYSLVYNGELYNTQALRAELEKAGCTFKGHSDTEVVLHAFRVWQEACVDRFNGIYAFAIWDHTYEHLFMARDRMGVKPFFYARRGDVLVFASELKALLEHPLVDSRISRGGIAELLLMGPGRTPGHGVFDDVHELLPGHLASFSRDGWQDKPYWRLEAKPHTEDAQTTIEHVRFLVHDAIEKQLVSDVPIGTFLSGGLDSSLITALASRHQQRKGQRLDTFSVDYEENSKYFHSTRFQPESDAYYIQLMKDQLPIDHHDVCLNTRELADALLDAAVARDLPGMGDIDASLLLFCKRVKPHVTVALSGECADELFGGYPWYRDEKIRAVEGFPWAQSTAWRSGFIHGDFLKAIQAKDYVASRYESAIADAPVLDTDDALEKRMKQMTYLNVYWFMQTLLDRKDRMSMFNGLEVRVPYCDHRIADYLYNVPWPIKNHQDREKGLLRAAMEGVLPQEVLWRKKSPYPKTFHPAYKEAVQTMLQDIMADGNEPLHQLVDREALSGLLLAEREEPWYGQLMTTPQTMAYFIQLNHWMKVYRVSVGL